MSKGLQTKSADDDARDRKAAQMRKKKGRGANREQKAEFLNGLTLQQVAAQNTAHAKREEDKRIALEEADRVFLKIVRQIREAGSSFLPIHTPNFYRIVGLLKDEFTRTDVRWRMTETGFMLAKERHHAVDRTQATGISSPQSATV